MADDTNTPVEATSDGPELILRHVLLTKVDVSKSKVDSQYYLRRAELLSLEYESEAAAKLVEDFFEASYTFRTVFSGADASRFSYAVYPTGPALMSSSPYNDVISEVSNPENAFIYSVLINVSLEDWKEIAKTPEYQKFVSAREAIKDVLGWDIPEYRWATVSDELVHIDKLTFEQAAALWDSSEEI